MTLEYNYYMISPAINMYLKLSFEIIVTLYIIFVCIKSLGKDLREKPDRCVINLLYKQTMKAIVVMICEKEPIAIIIII